MALAVLMGYFYVLFFVTLYFQRVHGYTASQTGVRLWALTGVMGISAFAGSRAVAKIGPRVPLLIGALLSAAGLIGLSRLGPHTSYSSIWPFLALIGLGFGPAQTAFARAIVGGAPPRPRRDRRRHDEHRGPSRRVARALRARVGHRQPRHLDLAPQVDTGGCSHPARPPAPRERP